MAYLSPSITASSATFSQLQAGGFTAVLEKSITANKTARSTPTTPATVSAAGVSTSGGSLAAGGYLINFTETNGIGETAASTESAAMTVATAGIPLITFPTIQTGNTARNLYATAANGATGTEVLYATGITTATYAMTAVAPSNSYAVIPPSVNTTGYTYTDGNNIVHNHALSYIRSFERGNAQMLYNDLSKIVNDYLRGDPIPYGAVLSKFRHCATAFATLSKSCDEVGVLLDANPGSLSTTATGTGGRIGQRTFP